MFNLDNLIGIIFIYVGFGAGLSVFMFTGFIKSIPVSLEEAAMIDGCSIMQIYFKVVFPVIRPIIMTVAILNAMWIWNDYLLPYLVIGSEYKTISVAIQYLRGGYGSVSYTHLDVYKRQELQKRVIDTIRKYNYNPSIYAQNLAGKKSRLLGFIMTNYINQYQLLDVYKRQVQPEVAFRLCTLPRAFHQKE